MLPLPFPVPLLLLLQYYCYTSCYIVDAMRGVHQELEGSSRSSNGAKAARFFFWVILIFSWVGFSLALDHHHPHQSAGWLNNESPAPRKERFFHQTTSFVEAPSSSPASNDGAIPDSDSIYEDDKRIIHTGPNPLHN